MLDTHEPPSAPAALSGLVRQDFYDPVAWGCPLEHSSGQTCGTMTVQSTQPGYLQSSKMIEIYICRDRT